MASVPRWVPTATIALLVGALACGRETGAPAAASPTELLVDLAEDLEIAEVLRETTSLDIGTTAARAALGEGWSWDETGEDGTTSAWTTGPASVRLHLVRSTAPLLRLRGWPLAFPGAPPQTVAVHLDGTEVGRLELPPGASEQTLALPLLDAGPHLLELVPAWTRAVREVLGGDDPRELGIAWDRLELERGGAPTEPPVLPRVRDATLVVPAGTEVAWFVLSPGEVRLGVDDIEERGARVEILVEADPPDGGVLHRGPEPPIGEIETAAERPVRIAIRAIGERGAVRLRGARVTTPVGPAGTREASEAGGPGETSSKRVVSDGAEPERNEPTQPPRNVVVWVTDTLRADRVGAYGHLRGTTPRLDALAERSFVFERARAQSSWTKSAMASLLTGIDPLTHGIRGPEHRLEDRFATLAELLAARGWTTGAISTNAHLTRASGFAQGIETWEERIEGGGSSARRVVDRVLEWIETVEEPFFLWVHVVEPHAPYEPEEWARRELAPTVEDRSLGTFDHVRALGSRKAPRGPEVVTDLLELYDAEILASDRALGRLLDAIEAAELEPRTIVHVLSDHGEAFGEHGVFGHGWDLHGEVLRIPWVLRIPGSEPRRIATPVQHADLVPTMVELLGLDAPDEVRSTWAGRSLVPLLDDGAIPRRVLVSQMDYEGRAGLAVGWGRYQLIAPRSADFGPRRLYDRVADPAELRDLSRERPVLTGWLAYRARALERAAGGESAAVHELDRRTRESLEALGYLQ